MDPLSLIAGAVKAFFDFLCTPEGQEFCKANREAIARFNAMIDTLVGKAKPLPPAPPVQAKPLP